MNKKGFTLIELLAVIVILTLLFVFAVPAISRYINQSRGETYEAHEASIEYATANKMSECVAKSTENCAPANGKSKRYTLKNLIDEGYSKRIKDPGKEGEFCSEEESYIVVYNSSSNVSEMSYQVCLKCPASGYQSKTCKKGPIHNTCSSEEQDREKPTCTVISSNDAWTNKDVYISVECNDDCGCKQDSYSEKVTESRRTTTITVADNYNKTTQCDPIDTYVDKDKPECKLEVVGTEHNGWYNGSTAPVVKMSTPTDKTSGVLTYGMGTSKSKADYNKEMEYTVKDGITTVYGYVKDRAGNEGQCSVEIKYDSGKPKVQTVDYGYIVYPKKDISTISGTTVTVNNILKEYGTIYGIYVYLTNNAGGTTVTANGESRTISAGVKTMRFLFSSGKQFNDGMTISFTGSPTISRIEVLTRGTSGYYTNKDVTMYINGSDSISGKAEYKFENGDWSTSNQRTYNGNKERIALYIRDKAGNVSNNEPRTIDNIDKLEPNVPIITRKAYNTFDWSVTDKNANTTSTKSNMRSYNINMSSTEPTTWSNGSSGTYNQVTTAGTYYVWAMDKAGNVNKNTINAYTVTRSQGTGTTLTTKFERSNGTAFTNNPVVLHNTPIYVDVTSLPGYYGRSAKKNSTAISLNATTNITENSTISSATTACAKGTYSNTQNATACTNCAAGTYQPNTAQTSCINASCGHYVASAGQSSQTECAKGKYQANTGQTSCTNASKGYYVASTGSCSQTACAKGTYAANTGSSACTKASCGHYVASTGQSSQSECAAGKYSSEGASSCTDASCGHYVANKGSCTQTACAKGKYQDGTGQTSCKNASKGYYVASTGSCSQTACAANTYQDETGKDSCKNCAKGYESSAGASVCKLSCAVTFKNSYTTTGNNGGYCWNTCKGTQCQNAWMHWEHNCSVPSGGGYGPVAVEYAGGYYMTVGGVGSRMCYYNPGTSAYYSQLWERCDTAGGYYASSVRTGGGDICFDGASNWNYYRSTEQGIATVCYGSQCGQRILYTGG